MHDNGIKFNNNTIMCRQKLMILMNFIKKKVAFGYTNFNSLCTAQQYNECY